jgi:hypothetical protein
MIRTLRDEQAGTGMGDFIALSLSQRGLPAPSILCTEPITAARVNQGRWIIDCPFCPGAVMADTRDPRFFCLSCLNEAAGGGWLAVLFPSRREEIEAELMRRPREENRNWLPGESLLDLVAETLDRTDGAREGAR